jgi:hypothetical protein
MTNRLASETIWLLLSLIAGSAMAGCGDSDRASVTGTLLRKDGAPLVGARVIARSPQTGESSYGITDAEGKFELGASADSRGVSPGDYELLIVEDRGDPDHRKPRSIAAKYRNSSTSGLSVNVKAGEQAEVNFTLDAQ